ncbi:hypothetical protein CRUP_020115 [Coryphaenoides rupestris]|nr:hypothetical protein CRUP_020115 [Coryphaenoides rupestris]
MVVMMMMEVAPTTATTTPPPTFPDIQRGGPTQQAGATCVTTRIMTSETEKGPSGLVRLEFSGLASEFSGLARLYGRRGAPAWRDASSVSNAMDTGLSGLQQLPPIMLTTLYYAQYGLVPDGTLSRA